MRRPIIPSLNNPFAELKNLQFAVPGQIATDPGIYEEALEAGHNLQLRPRQAAEVKNIERQHQKQRMTIWERINVLTDAPPTILYQNWGPNLDGASLVTAIIRVNGRDVALYGHDFTVRGRFHGRHQWQETGPPVPTRGETPHSPGGF